MRTPLAACLLAVAAFLAFGTTDALAEKCVGYEACGGSTNPALVADGSCNGQLACYNKTGSVAAQSCNGEGACHESLGPVGTQSCNGYASCYFSTGIGNYSCNGNSICMSAGPVGECQSNATWPEACLKLLTVAKTGSGSGTLTSTPAGIDCGATCSVSFPPGTTVTLLATAASGSVFTGWTNCPSPSGNQCTVTMNAPATVTASFAVSHSLAAAKAGTGSGTLVSTPAGINCGATCSAEFPAGIPVTLLATEAGGSVLTGWTGCDSNPTPAQCTVAMSAPATVTATFETLRTLTVAMSGGGSGTVTSTPPGINCGATCSADYAQGTSVTLQATAASGSALTGWTGCDSNPTPNQCTVAMNAAVNVSASFSMVLTIAKTGLGAGHVISDPVGIDCGDTCSAPFATAASVTLNAYIIDGATFVGWSGGGCSGTGPCTVTLNAPTTVTATFHYKCVGANACSISPSLVGDGSCIGNFVCENAAGPIGASSCSGQLACHNSGGAIGNNSCLGTGACQENSGPVGNNSCSGSAACYLLGAIGNCQNNAVIPAACNPTLLTAAKTGSGSGNVTSTPAGIDCGPTCATSFVGGTSVTLLATATGGSFFAGWTNCPSPAGNQCTVVVNTPVTVTATFDPAGPAIARPRDLSGDGRSDILLRGPGGEVVAWLMNGSAISGATLMLGGGSGYQATHFGDFNGDGKMDLLVVGSSGELVVWIMNGDVVTSSTLILGGGTGYVVDRLGDFDGDGKTDILFRGSGGDLVLWLMNGGSVASSAGVPGAGTGFAPVATGDFNDDGKTDIVIAHTDGRVTLWLMNGTTIASSANLLGAGTGYVASQVGDFNNDGRDDLLFKGAAGEIVMWQMNGTTIAGSFLLYGGGPWIVSHVADVNGDGMDDMALKGPGGEIVIWQMNGATITGATLMYGGGPWQISHVGDYNGDGNSDFLLKGPNGEIVVWIMNGSTITSATLLVGATTWAAMP